MQILYYIFFVNKLNSITFAEYVNWILFKA